MSRASLPVIAAGRLAVAVLELLRRCPPRLLSQGLRPALPLYMGLARPGQARRLRRLFAVSPFASHLTVSQYYRSRLQLFCRSLDVHARDLRAGEVRVQGEENYLAALRSNRPVTLLGLHLGVVEILHRLPVTPEGRPFRVITAGAFSPPLAAYMARGRERDGKRVLSNRDLRAGLREVLRKRGVLALMADQVPGRAENNLILWDGISIPYPARLLRFLMLRNCLFVPVSTRLEEDGKSAFRFHQSWDFASSPAPEPAPSPVSEPVPGPRPAGTDELESRLGAFLSAEIARAPDQYNWSYPKIGFGTAVQGRKPRPRLLG